jgi:hypothetical protein
MKICKKHYAEANACPECAKVNANYNSNLAIFCSGLLAGMFIGVMLGVQNAPRFVRIV